jgi:uncharacterized membrane protein YfcA
METLFLIGVSFRTSTFTAIIGMGGGIMLISAMPGLLPAATIIPIHGAVQLASNSSRALLGLRHVEWRIFWPFLGGAILGALTGTQAIVRLSFDFLPLYLGLFILLITWVPLPKKSFHLPGHFAILGAFQTFLSLFVGVSGPLTNAFLVREDLPKDRLVVTHGIVMTATHLCKILVFGFIGFAFTPYLSLIAGMILSATLGSWFGTKLRGRLSESFFRKVFKALITLLSIRMIINALPT